jgi:ABC-type branched-subunit amino acid transport system substrate-binding protein
MNVLNLLRLAVVSIIAALLSASAFAQKKESKEIVIGHVAGYTGPVTKDATELGEGAQVYFDAINARGGVLGRQIKFLKIDDHFKGDETVKELLALKGKVAAVMPPVGSAQFTQALKEGVVEKVDYPILGTIPGIESFRDPLRRNLFHYRAGDYDQIQKMIELTTSVGQNKVGVLATDNPNGEQVIAFMSDQLAKKNLKLAAVAKYVIGPKIDWAPMIKVYQQAQPDMILLVGPPFATAAFIKEAKTAGISSTLFGLSYTDFRLASKVAGNQLARGVAIAQVFPSPTNRVMPLIKEFRDNFEKYSKVQGVPSAFNLEGYIGAKILVEAIRRSKDASGPGTLRGLEMLKDWDMGGYVVDFSPTKHTGSRFVDMSMIGATGDLIY